MRSKTPSYKELKNALPESNPKKETYNGYHKRIFDYLYSLNADEVVTTDEIIDNAIDKGPKSSVSKGSKETRISEVQIYDPSLSEKIINKCPPGEVLLLKAKKRTGLSIDSQTLNKIQKECMAIADNAEEHYYNYLLDNYEEQVTNDLGITLQGQIDASTVEDLLEEFAFVVADDLPDRIESMNNSIVGCGGTANELIGVNVLEEVGLTKGAKSNGGDFTRVGSNSNEDIIVYSTKASDMEVEVKSSKARERTPRAIGDMDDPTSIFAFFDDASEVRSQIISGTSLGSPWPENSVAAYIKPETIEEVKDLDNQKSDGRSIHSEDHPDTGKLYLRANNRFAEDMKHYHNNGEIPDLSAGHHTKYI